MFGILDLISYLKFLVVADGFDVSNSTFWVSDQTQRTVYDIKSATFRIMSVSNTNAIIHNR